MVTKSVIVRITFSHLQDSWNSGNVLDKVFKSWKVLRIDSVLKAAPYTMYALGGWSPGCEEVLKQNNIEHWVSTDNIGSVLMYDMVKQYCSDTETPFDMKYWDVMSHAVRVMYLQKVVETKYLLPLSVESEKAVVYES